MAFQKKRWTITGGKFLNEEQVQSLVQFLLEQRDLAIARQGNQQAIRDFYAIRTLLETGLRVFEFCALTNEDFQGQKLTVKKGKGNKSRTVLLTKTTSLMLKEWFAVKARLKLPCASIDPMFPSRYHKRYTTRGVQKRVKSVFGRVGLQTHLSAHSLRHTYCSLLLASGKVSIATVKENLGHHSIAVTNLYSHAVGDLSKVELYSSSSSQNTELSELRKSNHPKKANSVVQVFLRNTNLK